MDNHTTMEHEKNRVALVSVLAAVFLTVTKIIVGVMTGSLGILSEALHSGLDLIAAVITYISVRISDKPADKQHQYGHGKVENISALMETILLLIACCWIVYEAVHRLVTGNTEIEVSVWAYIVVVTSIIVDISRSRALARVAKKYNSQALEADALHFSTDIWSSTVVLLGLVCAQFGFYFADPVAALIVAFIVVLVSCRLGKKALDVLLDRAPEGTVQQVESVLAEFPEIRKYHSLQIRTAGADTFVKVNIHLDPNLCLHKVHEICDRIEKSIASCVPRCETFLHAEPQETGHIQTEREEDFSATDIHG
ncbi:MAG: cation diffusion facilitator family transporter [Planctomycetaceae bacterium]|nr:cation diffusion facilitator family transporter [Planctomycetaceae bacterium]